MTCESFEQIWNRIVTHSGETFYTKGRDGKGKLDFIYKICGAGFYPSRTKYRISKSDFEKVYSMPITPGPGSIHEKVRGASYVWAVLNDPRIISEGRREVLKPTDVNIESFSWECAYVKTCRDPSKAIFPHNHCDYEDCCEGHHSLRGKREDWMYCKRCSANGVNPDIPILDRDVCTPCPVCRGLGLVHR